jgi:flagellar biosynthetic protein FlhB
MAEESASAEKEHEPSQKRLDDARNRGEVPQSADVTTAATYAGFLLACISSGDASLKQIAGTGAKLLDDADRLSLLLPEGAAAPLAAIGSDIAAAVAPFFALPAGAALLSLLAQRAITVSPEKLAPHLSRLSPLAGLSRKFGPEGLFDFAKNVVKMAIVSVVLGYFLLFRMEEIVRSSQLSPAVAALLLLELSVAFLCLVLLEAALLGGIDLIWQRHAFRKRNRMSRQEVLEEMRQSEGDPYLKSERRARGQEIATNRMLFDVPKADVIIVNPTHYAVALVWKRGEHAAPVCVAKGVDEVAARIRARAAEAGVPIHRDPPTARVLHASVEIGRQIRPEHYRSVAAAIRFAEAMRRKARRKP